jgi:hypothetical protein
MAVMRRIVEHLTDDQLERPCARSPAPGYPDEPRTVGRCVRAVMTEECEHHRYTVRDLAVLEEQICESTQRPEPAAPPRDGVQYAGSFRR